MKQSVSRASTSFTCPILFVFFRKQQLVSEWSHCQADRFCWNCLGFDSSSGWPHQVLKMSHELTAWSGNHNTCWFSCWSFFVLKESKKQTLSAQITTANSVINRTQYWCSTECKNVMDIQCFSCFYLISSGFCQILVFFEFLSFSWFSFICLFLEIKIWSLCLYLCVHFHFGSNFNHEWISSSSLF